MKKGITVFTPTYNRKHTLPRLYESLLRQNTSKFEWLIVDDGSTDNTKLLINKWIKESKINIRYIYQDNSGKQKAHNTGVINSNFELFICVDSDDFLKDNALKEILEKWYKQEKSDNIIGIIGYKQITNKDFEIKVEFPNIKKCTLSKLVYKYKYKYDTTLIYKTSILKNNLFFIAKGEKFIPENYLYDKLDCLGEMLLFPEYLCICEYLPDGYSAKSNKIIKSNPKSYRITARQSMLLIPFLKSKIKNTIKYTASSFLTKENNIFEGLNIKYKFLIVILFPISFLWYRKKFGGGDE